MNAEILKKAGIDYDYGVKRFVGRSLLYEKALTKFSKDSTFSRITLAYEAEDMEQLMASAHEFKGMCGNIALTSLYEASDSLVKLLRSDDVSAYKVAASYTSLKKEYAIIYEAVTAAMEV